MTWDLDFTCGMAWPNSEVLQGSNQRPLGIETTNLITRHTHNEQVNHEIIRISSFIFSNVQLKVIRAPSIFNKFILKYCHTYIVKVAIYYTHILLKSTD